MELPDYPPKVDIKAQIYETLPETTRLLSDWESFDTQQAARDVITKLSEALRRKHYQDLESLFATGSSYWKDTLALTAHLRTFKGSKTIASALLNLHSERHVEAVQLEEAQVVTATENLKWINCNFSFRTMFPRSLCRGKMMLIPDNNETGNPTWKIWSLSTWLSDFEDHPEDESLLRLPSSNIPQDLDFSADVLIIGGGNAGLILAARLKALDIDYVVVDRNKKTGDNWSQRYDCMKFHVYKSFCETPYIPYPQSTNDGLTRDQLAAQIQTFAREFDLDRRVLHNTTVKASTYSARNETWHVDLDSEGQLRRLTCKCVVLATGAGFSGAAPLPDLPGRELFKGPNMHSTNYRNASDLVADGAKSAVVVGSANTAFDVMVDCHDAGLKTTMVQRSETYVVPMTYFAHPMGFGAYDVLPIEDVDAIVSGGPLAVGGAILGTVHKMQAEEEPNRYDEARKAGLQVQDSLTGDLLVNLIDRCGGHFVDMGRGIELITSHQVAVRSGVIPKAYTSDGLVLADDSKVKADAIIWCTGFGNLDARKSLVDVMGDGSQEIAGKLEPTWGADAEGEVRGLWKRHPGVDNLWIFSGGTAQHRWFSKVIALQVKGVLEGIMPDAYRETPEPHVVSDQRQYGTWLSNL